jgi:ring-1,2-phenylacetyl-CoA epoxidase subunit PaaE
LRVIHVLEQDAQEIELFTGRVTEEKCADLFRDWIDVGAMDMAFICGPEPMMKGIARALEAHGMAKDRIKYELFTSAAQQGRLPQRATTEAEARARRSAFRHARRRDAQLRDGPRSDRAGGRARP